MMRMKLDEQRKSGLFANNSTESNRVKIRRKTKIELTESLLRQQFSPFGKILFVIVSKNGKSAVLEFEHSKSLQALEVGCPSNFEAEILSISRPSNEAQSKGVEQKASEEAHSTIGNEEHDDYEAFVFKQLQQAETNKRKAEN